MTTSAYPSPHATSALTYARARLWLGITGVGTAVLLATAALGFDLPARLLSTSAAQPLPEALVALSFVFSAIALLFLPFDIIGGLVLVRTRPSPAVFAARWLRGAAVQLLVWLITAAVVLSVSRGATAMAVIAAVVLLQLALARLRGPMARVVAALRRTEPTDRLRRAAAAAGIPMDRITLVETPDEGFVGGWSGLGARRLLVPARWQELPDDAMAAALRRRRIIAASGAHRRGVLGAIAWNTTGVAVTLALSTADVATAAGVLTLAAGMTLWAFLGVLVLPTPSRAAVFAVDAATARESDGIAEGDAALRDAITRLDRWQDDEERRAPGVETVFHPVPSRHARLVRLNAAESDGLAIATHHLARHALWLGWATLSPLSRLVHCNVGRPALWVMLPGD